MDTPWKHEHLGMATPAIEHNQLMGDIYYTWRLDFQDDAELECVLVSALKRRGTDGPVPDLGWYDERQALVVLELSKHKTRSAALGKCEAMVLEFGVKEAFVFVYDAGAWFRITKGRGGKPSRQEAVSDSEVLGIDLAELLG